MNKGELVPPDHLIDDQGRPTQDPRYTVVPPFGALLTFGAHKGYGMALMCELLGGALAAGMTQRDDDSSKRRVLNGMFSVLVDPAALGDRAAFEHEALAFIDWVKASPPREGFDARAGGRRARARSPRASAAPKGVPVDGTTWQEILAAAGKLGVDPARRRCGGGPGLTRQQISFQLDTPRTRRGHIAALVFAPCPQNERFRHANAANRAP